MFFDNLAGIVERHLPDLTGTLRKAKLFRMESVAPQSVGEVIDTWHPDERVIENFRLPFNTVGIEYATGRDSCSHGCVIFSHFGPPERRQLRFISAQGDRGDTLIGVGVLTALPDADSFGPSYGRLMTLHQMRLWEGNKKAGLHTVECRLEWLDENYDKVCRLERGNEFQKILADHVKNQLDGPALTERMRALGDVMDDLHQLQTNMAFGWCVLGILGVLIINEPARFVVEERPVAEVRTPPTTIPRSACRPHYIVLHPRQIRERFLWTNGADREPDEMEGCKVTPHERRGHFRHLQSDRFKTARGAVIWIKPMWVGPEEAIKGGNRYKVRLDL